MVSNSNALLDLIGHHPVQFRRFSKDIQQIDPSLRVASISGIVNRLSLPRDSTIVDFGTGYGYGAVVLNALGYKVIGIERNGDKLQEGMDYWQRLGIQVNLISNPDSALSAREGLYFLKRDIRDLGDFPDSSIEMGTAFYVSSYMAGEKAFTDIKRILKPDGKLAVTTEGPKSLPGFLRKIIVKIASKFVKPNGLDLSSTVTLEPPIHDRYVLIYDKTA